jgi:hypothetical protein
MIFNSDSEWITKQAALEDGCDVSVGGSANLNGWDSDSPTPLDDLAAMQLRNATPIITIRSIARFLDPPLTAFTQEK